MKDWQMNALAVAGTLLVFAVQVPLVMLGEPRTVWLWCDMMGFC